MITTRCPFCGNEIRIPDSILGKKVRCKNTSCQQAFTAAESEPPVVAAAPPQRSAPAYAPLPIPDLEPEWDTPSEPDYAAPTPQRRSAAAAAPAVKLDVRYPNLMRGLNWLRSILQIQLALELFGAAVLFIQAVYEAFTNERISGNVTLTGIVTSIAIAAIAYTFYVACMAIIEFAYVVVDIEGNTRRIADARE